MTPPQTKARAPITINSYATELVKMDEINFGDFHATNPFGNEIENIIRWDTLTEGLLESTIADMFSEFMSDYIPNSEQNAEITAAAERHSSFPVSPDSTNPVDGAENTMQNNAWPPLEVTDCSLQEWPNSNNKPLCEIDTTEEEAALQHSIVTTPVAAPRTPMIRRNPSEYHASTNSTDQNPFLSQYAQQGEPSKAPNKPNKNQSTHIEDNPLRYVFRTPPSRNLNISQEMLDDQTIHLTQKPVRKRPQIQPSQRTKRNRRQLGKISEIVSPSSPEYTHEWREKMAST